MSLHMGTSRKSIVHTPDHTLEAQVVEAVPGDDGTIFVPK